MLGAGVLFAIPAAAAPAGDVPQVPGVAMAISPPRLVVSAGQVTKVQRLEIENRGSVLLEVRAEPSALVQRPDGSVELDPDAPYSAVNWVTIAPSHIQISQGSKQYVQVRVHVPANAEPGDHNVMIIFMSPAGHGKGNIRIEEGLGVPMLITVPGPVIDHVRVTGLKAPGFSAGGPIPITGTIRELGDVHHSFRAPRDRLVADADGARILFPPLTVLRGSTVSFATRWKSPPFACICRITTAVMSDGQRSAAAVTVVVFPIVQVLTGMAALIAIALTLALARRWQRRRLAAAYETGRRDGDVGNGPPGVDSPAHPPDPGLLRE